MEPRKFKRKARPIHYPESYKRKVCEELVRTGVSHTYLREKYKIAGNNSINLWLIKFGYEQGSTPNEGITKAKLIMDKLDKFNEEELKARIKKLERELEDEKLRAHMYSRMIDIAEDQLNIKIRKKSDTK